MAELAVAAPAPAIVEESDFSPRKLRIAFACMIGLMLAGGGFAQGAIALITQPLEQEFGWKRATIGFALTLMTWSGALLMPFAGRYMDKQGARRLLLVTALAITGVTAALAFSTRSILQFYACFIVLGLLGASTVGYTKIIPVLFTRHRGKAFSIFQVEATVVAALMPPVMNLLTGHGGWRGLFLWLAAIKLVAVIPILFFWLRGPEPEGVAGPAAQRPSPTAASEGMTTGQALKGFPFWMLLAANIGGGITIYGLLPSLVGMMTSRGLSRGDAVGAMSFMSIFIAVGQFSSGFVVDKVRTARISAAYLVLFATGIFMVSRASAETGVLPLYFGIALMGLGGGAQEPMRNYFFTRYFGLKSFAEITGLYRALQAFLTAPAPALIGLVYDRTHSYAFAFILFLGCALSSIILLSLLPPYRYSATAPPAPKSS